MIDRRVLAQLCVGLFLLGMFWWAMSRPAWEKQFKATATAMEKAKTWHLKVSAKAPGMQSAELEEEVSCPKDYHSHRITQPVEGKPQTGVDIEVWVVGNKAVQRLGDKLITMSDRGWPPECGRRRLFDLYPLPPYQQVLLQGHGVRGDKKKIDGTECRVWTMQLPKGNGWGDLYDVCIDENNFPLELITKDGTLVAHASHWNEPIQLPQPPEVPQQAPASATE